MITKKLTATDVKYKILTSLRELDLELDQTINISFEGIEFEAKTHSSTKGRVDRLSQMFKDSGLSEGDLLNVEYDRNTNTLIISRSNDISKEIGKKSSNKNSSFAWLEELSDRTNQNLTLHTNDISKGIEKEGFNKNSSFSLPEELIDPNQNFALHSEYRSSAHTRYGGLSYTICPSPESSFCIYKRRKYILWNGDRIIELMPNGDKRIIKSSNNHFKGAMAVNRHGIFRIEQTLQFGFYLFDFDGKILSSLKCPKALDYYIYDNLIYTTDTKGNIVVFDIYNKKEPELIWSFKDGVQEICNSIGIIMHRILPKAPVTKLSISLRDSGFKIYANEKRVILVIWNIKAKYGNKDVRFIDGETIPLIISIDLKTKKPELLQGIKTSSVKSQIFSFDMARDTMWISKPEDLKAEMLFEAPIHPVFDEEPTPSHNLRTFRNVPNSTDWKYAYPHIDEIDFRKYLSLREHTYDSYFDGTQLIWFDGSMDVYFFSPNGYTVKYSDSYQVPAFEVGACEGFVCRDDMFYLSTETGKIVHVSLEI
jgi:hypothetical protein